ncbi:MAG: hypothetical protein R3F19_07045 [Verrucomicrobiales bacterium]
MDYLFPAGVRQGAENVVITVGGKFDQWPVKVWTNAADGWLRFVPSADEKKKGELTVSVAAECVPGAYLVRLYSEEGVSAPCIFVVGSLPEELEVEPNGTFQDAQEISGEPVVRVINGQLEKNEDVDCFAVELGEGQALVADVAAYVLDSPVDSLLHVRGPQGYRMAFNHDAPGSLLDPRLVFSAPVAGRYVLELAGFAYPPRADVRFTGSAATRYRLTLSKGVPLVTHTLPLAVERGSTRTIQVQLTDETSIAHELTVPATWASDVMPVDVPKCPVPVAILISDVGEYEEPVESLVIPSGVTGRIGVAGEVDRYPIKATKDVAYVFKVEAAAVGSALDPVVAIEDGAGKELASNDDVAHRFDPELVWKAPADGEFAVTVRSRFRKQSGAEFFYRLDSRIAKPEVNITAATDALVLKPGEKAELALTITRHHGYASAMTLAAEGLPEGIHISPTEIPADAKGEWKLTIESTEENAEPDCLPFQLRFRESGSEQPFTTIEHPIKGTNADAGELLVNATPDLWLTLSKK